MQMATTYYRLLQTPSWTTPYDMLRVLPHRQPVYPLLILPFLLVFGLSHAYFWAIVTNGVLYCGTIVGVFVLSRRYMSPLASGVAAMLFASYAWTLYFLHFAYTETAVSMFIVWAVYFLVASKRFAARKHAVLFGLFAALAVLTRWVALVFLAGPLVIALLPFRRHRLTRNAGRNMLLSLGLFVAIIAFPILVTYKDVAAYFWSVRVGGPNWDALPAYERSPFSLYSLLFYLSSFEQLGIFFFLIFCIGFFLALRAGKSMRVILSAIFIPWAFFSFFSILKSDRFIVPVYPYIALISATLVDAVRRRWIRWSFLISCVTLSAATFLGTVWAKGPMAANQRTVTIPFGKDTYIPIHLTGVSRPPHVYTTSGGDVVERIAQDAAEYGAQVADVTVLFSYRPLDEPMYTFNEYQMEMPLGMHNFVGVVTNGTAAEGIKVVRSALDSDYVLTKTGQQIDSYFPPVNYTTLRILISLLDSPEFLETYYDRTGDVWVYQDSSVVTIWRKHKSVPDNTIENLGHAFAGSL
jgi:hypothetical protein